MTRMSRRQPFNDGAPLFGRVLKDVDLHETRVRQQRLGGGTLDEVVERQGEALFDAGERRPP